MQNLLAKLRQRPWNPLLSVTGFGFLLAWTYVVFFSRLIHFSTRNSIEHLNSTYSFACCGIIAVLVLYAIPWRRPGSPTDGRTMNLSLSARPCLVAAVAVSLCTVVLTFVEHDFFRQPWCSIAATVSGAGLAVLFLAWSRVYIRCPGPQAFLYLALSFVLGAAVFVLVAIPPEPIALGLTYLLPLASCVLLNAAEPGNGYREKRVSLSSQTMAAYLRMLLSFFLIGLAESLVRALFLEVDPGSQSNTYQALFLISTLFMAAYLRMLLSFFLIGLAESLVRALFLEVDPGSQSNTYQALFLISTLLAAVVVTCAGRYKKNPARALNRVSLFVLVFLTMLAPIVTGLGTWGDLPALTCYGLFYLFVWATLTQIARVFGMPARFAFGWGLGSAYAGCLAGTFFGSILASFANLSYRGESLVALLCACLILVALVFVTDDRMLTRLMDTDSERPATPRRFMLRVEEAAREYGLTAKETEVLVLAAKGRTTQRICEELGISTGTANTHLSHIYKKFDVHDRQQLIDMLEGVSKP